MGLRSRKTALILLPIFGFAFWIRHRLYILATLIYTWYAFIILPFHTLGQGDGFDLPNLISPPNASVELVPRIIHQVRLGTLEMRPQWVEARQTCMDIHKDGNWTFQLWETVDAVELVKEYYPHVLDTFLGYKQEIQRSDSIRYMILHQHGGVYLDLDVSCRVPLDPLLTLPWISPPGLPAGVNNAFMAAEKGSPFLRFAVDRLPDYALNWYSDYVNTMVTAGCHWLSTMHALFPDRESLPVLPRPYKLGGYSVNPLFSHQGAASWHREEAGTIVALGKVFEWFHDTWKIAIFGGAVAALCLAGIVYIRKRKRRGTSRSMSMSGSGDVEEALLMRRVGSMDDLDENPYTAKSE